MYLLDINLLLGLAWPNHPFHRKSRDWFSQHGKRGWASCLATESAFIRLSSNPGVVTSPRRPSECAALLEAMKAHGEHSFLSDTKLRRAKWRELLARCQGHQQVNDAFLLALASSHGATLVTFDRRLEALSLDPNTIQILT